MKLDQVIDIIDLQEANVAAKIKDPKTIKMLGIAMRHDGTLPKNKIAALGTTPSEEQILKLWSDVLDDSLRTTDYGDISADGKFDEWLTRLYTNGVVDYEDINGEGGDALGAWKALSIRGKLAPAHQDFNKFKSLKQIQRIIQDRTYRDELRRIKDAEVIEKHKREKKETTLIDSDRFLVTLPYNYGACYTFNNSAGYQASFCTGSSSGLRWFERYAPEGPIISIIDKDNIDDVNGKWQMHAPTGQMNNGNQSLSYDRGDQKFAELFPGLMKKIIAALKAKATEVTQNSTDIVSGGYKIDDAIADIKRRLPASYASEAKEEEPEPEQDENDGPGTYLVTHIASNRTARIEGDSKEDVINKVLTRYPNMSRDDFNIEKAQAEE
jgi:hypothetical protein